MLPVSVKLHNFMSYKDAQTFEFDKIDSLACFTGNNGHGKSCLLDSFAWALWGEVANRKPSGKQGKIDSTIINTEHDDMYVEAVFSLNDGQVFKIIRSYSRRFSKEKRSLDVHTFVNGTWRSISSDLSSLNETELIARIVPVSYQTFINTSYLVQNKYDEFTRKPPNKRKELIIPLIVDHRYALIHKHAYSEKKNLDRQLVIVQTKLEQLQQITQDEDVLQQEYDSISQSIVTLTEHRDACYQKIQDYSVIITETQHRLSQQQQQVENLKTQRKLLKDLQDKCLGLQKSIQAHKNLINQKDSVDKEYQTLRERSETIEVLDEKERVYASLQKTITQKTHNMQLQLQQKQDALRVLESRIEECENFIDKEKDIIDGYARFLQLQQKGAALDNKQAQHFDLCERKRSIENDVHASFLKKRERIIYLRTQLEELDGDLLLGEQENLKNDVATLQQSVQKEGTIIQEIHNLEQQINTLKERSLQKQLTIGIGDLNYQQTTTLIKALQEDDDSSCVCPVCLTSLSKDNNNIDVLIEHSEFLHDRDDVVRKECEDLRNQIIILEQKLTELTTTKRRIELHRKTLHQKEIALAQITQDLSELERIAQEIYDREKNASDELLQETLKEQTRAITQEIQELGFSPEKIKQVSEQLVHLAHFKEDKDRLESSKRSLREYRTQSKQQQEDVTSLQESIRTKDFITEETQQQQEILQAFTKAGLSFEEFDGVKKQFNTEYNSVTDRYYKIQKAVENINNLKDHYNSVSIQIAEVEARIYEYKNAVSGIDNTEHTLRVVSGHKTAENKKYEELQRKLAEQTTQSGKLHQQLSVIVEKKEEYAELYNEFDYLNKQIKLHEYLIGICGRDGIPTQLLKDVTGAFDYETNEILSKISGGTTTVKFETDKFLKGGDRRDTFDIKIDTDGYQRYYESYSGGQKFRIDFAVRIGLSKVLAYNAGSPLQFLAIDEGFGTQDDQGLKDVIMALKEIQNDFKQIVIITHLEKLQALFDSRVVFEKHPIHGTQFTYI